MTSSSSSSSDFNFDFNKDGAQKTFDVIPESTICTVQMTVRPGGAGSDGCLTRAKDGNSEHLNCEFVVLEGTYAKRKFWNRYTVIGSNHDQAIEISRKALKAMLESARGVRPSDESEAAKLARQTKGWADFDQLRFVARVGVEPAKDEFAAKNTIREVITPEKQVWKKPEQIDRDLLGKPAAGATASAPAPALANTIARPQWAG
jgi:hypothetical protein